MIVDHIRNVSFYKGLNEKFDKAFEYIQNTNLEQLEPGFYEMDGEELFFNLVEYETKSVEERVWETHKKYIDIQVIVEGNECIGYEHLDRLNIKEDYNEQDDISFWEGSLQSKVILEKGDFIICYPHDAHMAGMMVNGNEKVRKAVFKVKI
ncbi:YhcH/YjgK/YiaL family protein [Neobacillus vireti]|uniref:YhcH/YjgK/YiaL family protein n=1 Tax=Neobacillus vireti TaxID=220686 RepID=UPI003000326E